MTSSMENTATVVSSSRMLRWSLWTMSALLTFSNLAKVRTPLQSTNDFFEAPSLPVDIGNTSQRWEVGIVNASKEHQPNIRGVESQESHALPSNPTNGSSVPPKPVFGHFLSHIPKTGTTYAVEAIRELLFKSPEMKALEVANPEQRFRPCNVHNAPTRRFHQKYMKSYGTIRCTMWISEAPYTPVPQHIYTIVRNPKHHIISQYFHCKESKTHKTTSHRMPSTLGEWLRAHVEVMEDRQTVKSLARGTFHCYNPLNFQSAYVQPKTKDEEGTIDELDLKDRYDVIGDSSQMDKTLCLIAIRYAGWVPPHCNCSSESFGSQPRIAMNNTQTNISLTAEAIRTQTERAEISDNSTTGTKRRRLERAAKKAKNAKTTKTSDVMAYDPNSHGHGVKHHGAEFPTTTQEDEWIDALTKKDQRLYESAVKLLAEQVHQVEQEYQFKLCGKFRSLSEKGAHPAERT